MTGGIADFTLAAPRETHLATAFRGVVIRPYRSISFEDTERPLDGVPRVVARVGLVGPIGFSIANYGFRIVAAGERAKG